MFKKKFFEDGFVSNIAILDKITAKKIAEEYMIYTAKDLFAHENLSFDIIQNYMKKFFFRCILFNPHFIMRRIIRGIRTGEFFWDAYYALRFYFLPTTGNESKSSYYAKEHWPQYDFKNRPPKPAYYQIARKNQPKVEQKLDVEMQR